MVLNHWGHIEELDRHTVSNYLSSAKQYYTEQLALTHTASPVWGAKGHSQMLVSQMLKSIPYRPRTPKQLIDIDWIKDGFQRCWTTHEYVAIAFMLGWMLRTAEVCNTSWNGHLLTWSAITFKICRNKKWSILPMHLLPTIPCDLVELLPPTRKYQTTPRKMPGRVNTCHLKKPAQGTTTWCNLCMPTIIQGWALQNNIHNLTVEQRAHRPFLAAPGSNVAIQDDHFRGALRRLALLRHEDPKAVVPHCLRRSGINALANSEFIGQYHAYLAAVGHHSLKASEAYQEPSPFMAQSCTANMNTHLQLHC